MLFFYKIKNKLSSIVKKGKDKLDKGDQHNVVYKIACINCEMVYIGETKRTLKTRIKEHRDNINLTNSDNHNAITLHRIEKGHDMNWDNVKILDNESNYRKWKFGNAVY